MVFYVIICVIILYILIATTAYFFKLQGKDIYLDKIEINLSKHKSIKITTKASKRQLNNAFKKDMSTSIISLLV